MFKSMDKMIRLKKAGFAMAFLLCSGINAQITILSYDLQFEFDLRKQAITGINTISFSSAHAIRALDLMLFPELKIDSLHANDQSVSYTRSKDSLFIQFRYPIRPEKNNNLTIYFSGKPKQALKPPWSGGFVWTTDSLQRPWVNVSCQNEGAQLWWPVYPPLDAEPLNTKLTFIIPDSLEVVSNGRKTRETGLSGNRKAVEWQVSYSINTYNISFYIGKYVLIADTLLRNGKVLDLSYYVLDYEKDKAEAWFGKQVKMMLRCFEDAFGAFPFENDGYKIVQSTYAGMEHQTAIAYGNGFASGYNGLDYSGLNLDFDFILVHESGHEWWGNSISKKEKADFWIHEAFCTYAEKVYVACRYGDEMAEKYIFNKRKLVENKKPIAGKYTPAIEAIDLYAKGALFLNNLEHIFNRNGNWNVFLKSFAERNKNANISTQDIIQQFSVAAGMDLKFIFMQYLYHSSLPELEYQIKKDDRGATLRYRWNADVSGFNMPLKAQIDYNYDEWFYPETTWKELRLNSTALKYFKWRDDLFYASFVQTVD